MNAITRIFPEKRKGITKNVPLQLHIFLNGKRVSVFNTGFRCDIEVWEQDKQGMKKNSVNKAGQTAATVNNKIKALRGAVDVWAVNNPHGTKEELLKELRTVAGKKEKIEKQIQADFYSNFDHFLLERKLSDNRHEHYLVLKRTLQRFERYTGQPMTFELDLHAYQKYLSIENTLIDGQKHRGLNTVTGLMAKLRSFFRWAETNELTGTNPFNRFKIGTEQYGTPFYLSINERNHVYNFDFTKWQQLAIQRDIFIFHCFVGCRVSDLLRLKPENVIDGFLEYVAGKTSDKNPVTVRVPLTDTAKEIINRYKGNETLLPCISLTHYNEAIREILTKAGVNRNVTVLNTITRKDEQKPINEVASSHIARRTFIGNLYSKVQDPNLVGSLSGHVEGSKAFARYRNIDDTIKTNVINLIQ